MEYTKLPLRSLSVEQLKELRKQIAGELNYREHSRLMENKSTIGVGSTVIVNHPKTSGKEFRVTSMRRTRASIQNINNTRESYNLPIAMMQIA